MFIITYKVTSPNVIEEFIDVLDDQGKQVIVKVDVMAICKADIRYYLGNRDIHVLEHKYPLAPIHEAVGHVVKDPSGHFKPGDKVILIPNYVDDEYCLTCQESRCHNPELGENYCPHAMFKSSSMDGFMKTFYATSSSLLVKYDASIDPCISVFSELLSVSFAASRRINFASTKQIAIFGDGIMGYMVYIILSRYYHANVTVFGMNPDKLKMFKNAKTHLCSEKIKDKFDTLIECVGGNGSASAINQMIDLASIGGDLILMGVSENKVEINTRKILEKGLVLKGVTRSTKEDFIAVSKLIENKNVQDDIKPLILSIGEIKSVNDVYNHFEMEINNRTIIGKNLMKF
jgi:ribitol-5-phosphate 2-dehydrogenase